MGTCEEESLDSLVNQFNITSDSVLADDNGGSSSRLPLRPHAGDCPLYLKSGTCKYGFICKFNHPAKRPIQAWADKNYKEDEEEDDDDDEERLREDQSRKVQCKYYFSSGGCKYGQSCRYSHFKANSSFMNLNFIGLPIRWGEKECPYYMRTGSCGYGLSCRFNHPNPTTCTRSDLYNQNLAPQGVLQSFEDSGYQVPSYFQESDMDYHPTPALSSFTELGELPLQVEEFPQRPGQPNCEYFMKTGGCKFKSACWYHHPKFQPVITDVLNDKGLPLRPGRKVCWHYENCGICKYGPSCLFDHP